MSLHTPGPWSMSRPMGTRHLEGHEPCFWVSADRTLHIWVQACADGFVVGENEANARLIAAAPCLLAAAELALANLMRNLASEEACGQPFMGDDEHEAIAVLSAVIAKARGDA